MDIMEKTLGIQQRVEEKTKRLGKGRFGRVLKMARKPTREEYMKTIQITSIGIALVGLLGFLIFLAWEELPGLIKDLLNL